MSARAPRRSDEDGAGPRRIPSPRRLRSPVPAASSRRGEQGKVLLRPSSEPALPYLSNENSDDGVGGFDCQSLPRFFTCNDVCSPPTCVFSLSSPHQAEGGRGYVYTEESKVVVSVTVEESPGPVLVLVKLGATVEEVIRTVVDKYGKEGRRPPLVPDASSSFQLYHSYFCFQGFNGSEKLGDVGGRKFYLRRIKNSDKTNVTENGHGETKTRNVIRSPANPKQLFLNFIIESLNKLGRRTRNLCKLLGCIPYG